jgi:hypothetical protein
VKINELPKHSTLNNIRFRYPGDGKIYYWTSQWQKGVWGKKDLNSGQVFPLFVENLKDALEWEIVDEKNEVKPKKVLKKAKQSEL